MSPAEQIKAKKAAYMRDWRKRHYLTALRQSHAAMERYRDPRHRLAALNALPTLTLRQVCEWLRLKAARKP